MAVNPFPMKPIVEALENLETSAVEVVLAASEQTSGPCDELGVAITRLGTALWELQATRAGVAALASEVGTPPLYVVELRAD
jgi:hypothetical protein